MSVPIWPPKPGFYKLKLVRGGVYVPVRIWHGPPVVDGEPQDRSPRWCVAIDGRTTDDKGELFDIERAWPFCAKEPIDGITYHYMVAYAQWARAHNIAHPKAQPRRAVDFNTLKVRF